MGLGTLQSPDETNQLQEQKEEVHPGFEPGLLEDGHGVKIQSDNHYTNEPYSGEELKEATNTTEDDRLCLHRTNYGFITRTSTFDSKIVSPRFFRGLLNFPCARGSCSPPAENLDSRRVGSAVRCHFLTHHHVISSTS